MAIAVVIKENDVVYVAADFLAYNNGIRLNIANGDNQAVWQYKNRPSLIFSVVGSRRDINLLKTKDLIDDEFNELNLESVTKIILPKIVDELVEHNRHETEKGFSLFSRIIIAEKDRAFLIDFDGSITEVNDFYIHGRDTDIFYGVMHAVKDMCPKEKLKKVYEPTIK